LKQMKESGIPEALAETDERSTEAQLRTCARRTSWGRGLCFRVCVRGLHAKLVWRDEMIVPVSLPEIRDRERRPDITPNRQNAIHSLTGIEAKGRGRHLGLEPASEAELVARCN